MHPSASAGVRLSAMLRFAALVILSSVLLGSIFITSFTGSENESLLVQHALDAALASENVETVVNLDRACRLGRCAHNGDGHPLWPCFFPAHPGVKVIGSMSRF